MKRDHQAMIALFLVPLYLLAVLNMFWPAQTVSAEENRNLQQMPAFSWKDLSSGQFTRTFETYFSDQFPFRSFFIQVNQQLTEWLKISPADAAEIIEGPGDDIDLGNGERLEPDESDLVTLPAQPTQGASPSPLPSGGTEPAASPTPSGPTPTVTPLPTLPVKPTLSPTAGPTPGADGAVEKISGVIIVDNRAMELYSFSESRTERYVRLINRLQEKVPEIAVYSLVAPTAVEFYSPEKYHSLSSSQKNAIANIYGRMNGSIRTVDAYSEIVARWQDYLYFRTDHHWTARGAHCAYIAFARTAGLTPVPLSQMETGIVPGDFLGSLYRYTKSSKLKENPDFVEYFLPTVSSEGIAFTSTAMTEGYRIQAVRTTVSSTNKYLAFIQGDNPLVRLTTTLTNGRKILVLKESFGNALVPFLLNHYQEVYVIDPRSLTADLPGFISKHGIQEVLVVNYAFAVSNTKWLDGFEKMIG